MSPITSDPTSRGAAERRPYESPLRRQQAADTRERIVVAGAGLLRDHGIWKWRAVTVRAVAEQAAVNERTVYRYFPNEQALRDAVLDHLRKDAGVSTQGVAFDDMQDVTRRVFQYVASFPVDSRMPDATVAAASAGQRSALLDAIGPVTDDWDESARAGAAAVLDVLWSTSAFERLVANWQLEPADAADALTWAIGLVQQAIRDGQRPTDGR